jgi:hypothetical protein
MWDPAELILRLLGGDSLSRRQKACIRQHLQRVAGRLSPSEFAAAEALGLTDM